MGSDSWQGQEVFLSSKNIHTQPPVQWVPGSISVKVKQLGHEADHSSASGANVVSDCNYNSTPLNLPSWCVQLQLYIYIYHSSFSRGPSRKLLFMSFSRCGFPLCLIALWPT